MNLSRAEVEAWAAVLRQAHRDQRSRAAITDETALGIDDAYAVQDALTALRIRDGEKVVGWKLGYTSLAMRAQMGVQEPNFGPLTDAMVVPGGHQIVGGVIAPRVEPEIGMRFATELRPGASVLEVLAATAEAFACLEVVDSAYCDYRFRLEDNTADGSSACLAVVGPTLDRIDRLDSVDVTLSHNGTPVASATGAAASGHPAAGVVWLVDRLAERGLTIGAGDIVITGGLTAAVALAPGDHVEAVFDTEIAVSVRRTA